MLRTLIVFYLCFAVLSAGSDRSPRRFWGWRRFWHRSCKTASDCRPGQCCRDRQGNLIGDGTRWGGPILGSNETGYCSRRPSRPGQVCLDSCGCTEDHTCYRTVTGICCPPRTCWTKQAARKDREYWDNCRPPTCFFPPSANPGGV